METETTRTTILVTEDFLRSQGFHKDETCPSIVNRWEKSDGETYFTRSYWVSITLSVSGSRTLYGVINFHSGDGFGYITEHRSFNNAAISVEDFNKFMDRRCENLPEFVKTTRNFKSLR